QVAGAGDDNIRGTDAGVGREAIAGAADQLSRTDLAAAVGDGAGEGSERHPAASRQRRVGQRNISVGGAGRDGNRAGGVIGQQVGTDVAGDTAGAVGAGCDVDGVAG